MHELSIIAATVSVCGAILSILSASAVWVAVKKNNRMAQETGTAMVMQLERLMKQDAFVARQNSVVE